MLKKLVNLLNKVIPKGNIIVFNSFPNVSGNVMAVYDCLVNKYHGFAQKYKLVWIINDNSFDSANKALKSVNPTQRVIICKKKSVKGLWLYCRSKYVLTSHNYITGVGTYGVQKNYNLWHGMPFKAIGKILGGSDEKDRIQGDYTIATSPLFQDIMASSFGLPKENVLVTGQPCNDMLFNSDESLRKLGVSTEKYSKIIMWMPTYRKSVVGAIHNDGNVCGLGVETVLRDYFNDLDNILKSNEYLLLIKPHPMDVINTMKFPESENIRVVRNEEFDKCQVDLYTVLGETDVLLTDYSSAFIDYLIVDKPIAFVFDDLDKYEDSRGFNFKKPLDYMPGEKITSCESLFEYLNNIDKINAEWNDRRKYVTSLFHSCTDNCSSDRVCKEIFGL